MSLRSLLNDYEGRLTKTDRKVLSVLLADPMESIFLGVNQLALQAGVHAASVVRVAKKLGFSGYPELRQRLRDDLNQNTSAERIKKRLARMGDGSILTALIASEIEALQAIPNQIGQEQIDQSVKLLCISQKILVFGTGHAAALAELMARRLRRSSYQARTMHHIDWETPEIIMNLGMHDVLLFIITQNIPHGLPELVSQVSQMGVSTIGVSEVVGNFLRPKPDVLLAASRGGEGHSQSLTVPMAICNTLILEMSKYDNERSLRSLRHLADVRSEFARQGVASKNILPNE